MILSFWHKCIVNIARFACKVCCANSAWAHFFYTGCSSLPIHQSFHGLSLDCKILKVCLYIASFISCCHFVQSDCKWSFFTWASFNEGLIFVADSICIWTVTFTLQVSLPLVPVRCCCVGRTGLLAEWLRGISILRRDQNSGPPILSSLTESQFFFYTKRSNTCNWIRLYLLPWLEAWWWKQIRAAVKVTCCKGNRFVPLSNKRVEALFFEIATLYCH